MHYLISDIDSNRSFSLERSTQYVDIGEALAAIEAKQVEDVLLCDAKLMDQSIPELPADLEMFDLLHSGLSLGARQTLSSLWLTSTNWFFLDPPAHKQCTSWKATPAFCWLRPPAVRDLGGFDRAYQSPVMQLMDLAYRILMAGGRVCHQPLPFVLPDLSDLAPKIPLVDELLFVYRHVGCSAALYVAFWKSILTHRPLYVLRSLQEARRKFLSVSAPIPSSQLEINWHTLNTDEYQYVDSVSAIIPTINRYSYLPQAIDSLLKLDPQPQEIIVVDQTPAVERQMEIYSSYQNNPKIRVFYLDEAGQSIARNVAIKVARCRWCLLFEDDTVAWDNLLAEHIRVLEHSGAVASTGVSLAPWKKVEHIPPGIRMYRVADVLATGNCLARKDALLAVGGLDQAFDHGSGADNDLGLRLYMAGYETITNPKAIETHYKAAKGGMRTYGAWWRNHATIWGAYPQATQVYTIRRYYPKQFWLPLYLLYYIKAWKQMSLLQYVWLWISLPWKLGRSIHAARKLLPTFIQNDK
ncbi:MAG: glycosyltransferase family 2 protein [Anaerolineales bacterium]|nr:glycosyltransferase family 2 protein [Anaerolineales bacterium]